MWYKNESYPNKEKAVNALIESVVDGVIEDDDGVKISDTALVSAAELSNRYISDRFLPDKAIDLVDEACALIKTEMNSLPTELDELNRKKTQMEIEVAALKKEDDNLSRERLEVLQRELAEVTDEFNNLMATWENEKA